MGIRNNDHLTVHTLKELLEVIDTNRKAALAMWYVTMHDADEKLLDEGKAILTKIRKERSQ